jgi:hypothetical protein
MKTYHITIIGGSSFATELVKADNFTTTTNSSTSSGFYAFYLKDELVACYPINRTIIKKIESY